MAAFLLSQQGHRVFGVTLALRSDPEDTQHSGCCSPEALTGAKAVAHHLGIPHVVVDAAEAFQRDVIDYFVSEYERGRTPNPCMKCNARVRFFALFDAARRLGASQVATGHYARLGGTLGGLARALDRAKDQSYVLAEVPPDVFRGVVFPLGGLTKDEVRAIAAQAGLLTSVSPESQEICFVPAGDHRAFLRARLGEQPGSLVDHHGRVLGRHSGIYNYTVGQRRGLGCSTVSPRYVLNVDAASSEVVLGPWSAAGVGAMVLDSVVVHRSMPKGPLQVQFRSNGAPVTATPTSGNTLLLLEPAFGVAPGQTAVLYADDKVVSAGTIVETKPWIGSLAYRLEPKAPVV